MIEGPNYNIIIQEKDREIGRLKADVDFYRNRLDELEKYSSNLQTSLN
jgi:hypothetical protein